MSNMKKIEKNEKQKETLIKVLKYMKPYRWLVVLTILMAAVSVAPVCIYSLDSFVLESTSINPTVDSSPPAEVIPVYQ